MFFSTSRFLRTNFGAVLDFLVYLPFSRVISWRSCVTVVFTPVMVELIVVMMLTSHENMSISLRRAHVGQVLLLWWHDGLARVWHG